MTNETVYWDTYPAAQFWLSCFVNNVIQAGVQFLPEECWHLFSERILIGVPPVTASLCPVHIISLYSLLWHGPCLGKHTHSRGGVSSCQFGSVTANLTGRKTE